MYLYGTYVYIDITYLQQNVSTIYLHHHQSVKHPTHAKYPGNPTDPPTTRAPATALCRGDYPP